MWHWLIFIWILHTAKDTAGWCLSFPVYPVIIGNVRGARRMLPHPDWGAEDQLRVRARTSGGNKDKDNDGDQGEDIPTWMFKKKSNQEKTKKSAQKKRL